jgi:hypothetical protein
MSRQRRVDCPGQTKAVDRCQVKTLVRRLGEPKAGIAKTSTTETGNANTGSRRFGAMSEHPLG